MIKSYNLIIKKDGALRNPKDLLDNMTRNDGNVYELIEEMYGMIWFLAVTLASEDRFDPADFEEMRDFYIEEAKKEYKAGQESSPTKRFQPPNLRLVE